ncbi:CHRD domain-containing protein [Azohydromonas aeria]|uniref:CHRD domain-containing protein n=1 Tax=Azohydromonas aeria TaxID=2590212 RepID=UPI0012F91263|nr:CHRD domain-containing protein [Azohydromonas aeria]
MKLVSRATRAVLALALAAGSAALMAAELKLSGDQEVPPVTTSASGSGNIAVAADGTVSGSVKVSGVEATAAHIHHAPPGKNGPVIIPLTKGEGGSFSVPAGARLNADQMKAYQAGELYVNVHSAANPGGEVRAQIKP